MKLAVANDHAGYNLKLVLKKYLEEQGHEVKDFGTHSGESCDYPDFAHPLATAVENGEFEYGFTLCSSGNGINMTANKHKGIRAALCWTEEIAKLAREHNNANICSMPANFISKELALNISEIFLSTKFEGGRHERRINKIPLA